MKRSSRARTAATVSVGALSLVLITGCGGGADAGDGKDTADKGKASAPASTAKALSAAELEKLIVAKADLTDREVKPATAAQQIAENKDELTVKDAACEPLAYVLTGFAPGDESAYVNRVVTQAAPTSSATAGADAALGILGSTITIVSLSSYDGDGAQRTMKAVADAVSGCADGFTLTPKDQEVQEFTKVAAGKPSGTGDESTAFTVTAKTDDGTTTVEAEVVRHGSTVATYYAINLASMAGKKADTSVPAEIVEAQTAKLK